MKIRLRTLACFVAVSAVLAGCGGGGGDSAGATTAASTGTLHVSMTDSPSCGFDHVYVTVAKVRVNMIGQAGDTDSGWSDVTLPAPQKVDLLSLNNDVLADLGQTALPSGQYQQDRLLLVQNKGNTLANSVVPTGGSEQPLDTRSATQSGYKIIQPLTVQPNTSVDLIFGVE